MVGSEKNALHSCFLSVAKLLQLFISVITVLQSTISQECFVLCEVRSVAILFISELWLKKNPVRRMPMPWKQEGVPFKDARVFLHALQAGVEHTPEQVMQCLRTGTPRGGTKFTFK